MIKIDRPATAPSVLSRRGKKRCGTHCKKYDLDTASYQNGTATFPFDSAIYAETSVKEALVNMQHRKCCYCERIIGTEGDVEHFRPKGSVCQDKDSVALTPGYYWLAYEWNNLLFSCKECNQLHKGTQFPIADPDKRIRSHNDTRSLADEEALLINPAETAPNLIIGFRREFVYAIDGDAAAEATIRVCGLNRPDLTAKRAERLEALRDYLSIVELQDDLSRSSEGKLLVARARRRLAEAKLPQSEFSAMVMANMR